MIMQIQNITLARVQRMYSIHLKGSGSGDMIRRAESPNSDGTRLAYSWSREGHGIEARVPGFNSGYWPVAMAFSTPL